MACEPNEAVIRIAELRKAELALMRSKASPRALMAVQAETCAALTELLTDHGGNPASMRRP